MGIKKYFIRERAIIKDDHGTTIDKGKIGRGHEKFKVGERTYNVIRNEMYYYETRGVLFHTRHYFYNVNNSNPLNFNKTTNSFTPMISPELYTKLLENEVLLKLNSVKGDWLKNIGPGAIVIGLVVLGLIAYAINSGVIK